MITAEQFAEWKEHPVTKEIFGELQIVRDDLQERLSSGQTLAQRADETHGMTNKLVVQLEGMDQMLNISYAVEESDDDVSDVTGH